MPPCEVLFAAPRAFATTRGAAVRAHIGFELSLAGQAIMAGKMQFAAKCLLGTTLLASGTGGVYYATLHGWSLPGHQQETKQAAASDLDAVAGAWSEPLSTHA